MDILTLLIVVPLLTVGAILTSRSDHQVRVIAAIGASFQLLQSLYLTFQFLSERKSGNSAEMLFMKSHLWFESLNIRYDIGVDGISVAMILLTAIVLFCGVFTSWNVKDLSKEFFISLIILSTGVFGFFISIDLFVMFLFFELAVIPMYLLIGIWGSGPKGYAAMKLTLMLMGGSALILVGILGIYFNAVPQGHYTFNILEIANANISITAQRIFFPLTFIGFGVIGAIFPLHTWSPDGHASAPTAVSMLHAGVLMKLGGYGCFRVAIYLMPEAAAEMSTFFIILATISIIYGALGAVVQKDLKYINAYSSISHCGLVLFALLVMNKTAMNGAILQMISHGLMCALFFALIGMIYGRTKTRMINEMGGLMKVIPFLSICYVITGLASLGLPGFSGFVAEMTIFVGAFQNPDPLYRLITVIACASIVVTAVYILRVVAIFLLGPVKNENYIDFKDADWHEKVVTVVFIIAIAGMGLAPLWLSNMIMEGVEPIFDKLVN